MNTDRTLSDDFIKSAKNIERKPTWYYKQLTKVNVDYVIAYLLKDKFVLELDGIKYEIKFGLNKSENYIGQYICNSDFKKSNLCSYEIIREGFIRGTWYIIADCDTSDTFKSVYDKEEDLYTKKELRNFQIDVISSAIRLLKNVDDEYKKREIDKLESKNDERLDELMNIIFEKCK